MNQDQQAPTGADNLATETSSANAVTGTTPQADGVESTPVKRRRSASKAAAAAPADVVDAAAESVTPTPVPRTRKASVAAQAADVAEVVVGVTATAGGTDLALTANASPSTVTDEPSAKPARKSTRKRAVAVADSGDEAPAPVPQTDLSLPLAMPTLADSSAASTQARVAVPAPGVMPATELPPDILGAPASFASTATLPTSATSEPAPEVAVLPVALADVQDGAPAETSGDGSRRKRDRNRRREHQGDAGGGDVPRSTTPSGAPGSCAGPAGVFVVAPAEPEEYTKVDVADRYADVLSGDYDGEESPVVDAPVEAAEPGKRVLRPEPEAPKLHKVLAQAGVGSRRDMEELIAEGRITVNGEVAHQGMRITYGDKIQVGGKLIKYRIAPPVPRVLAYHKPVGEVVTHHDPEGRPTVFRQLPRLPQGKWLSVGRLDINTEGLLLFTNSGDLAHQLMHPRFGVDREYAVRVLGSLNDEARAKLLDGVEIDGQTAAFKSIDLGAGEGVNQWYRVVIGEGRNREVRKLFDSVGLGVSRLIRIRYGQMVLPRGLKRGVWVELSDQDVAQIRQFAGMGSGHKDAQRGDGQQQQRPGFQHDGGGNPKQRGNKQGGAQQQGQRFQGGGQANFTGGNGPQGGPRGGQGQARGQQGSNWGQGPEGQRGPKPGRKGQQGGGQQGNWGNNNDRPGFERRDNANPAPRAQAEPRDDDQYDDDIPLRIPNPLEQTFDRRFATGTKRIVSGFGRPSDEPRPSQGPKGGPKQPDPMQTSVGYIGADAYFTRPGGGHKNRGGGGHRR
ncbi:MAG: hypothetical protein RIQ60_1091 [Pseudomonadota bacterium]|jgi:23S rRNA pseudouridine2605 synthase